MKTFRDVYTLPLKLGSGGWIYDQNDHFVAQINLQTQAHRDRLVRMINGDVFEQNIMLKFRHEDGIIEDDLGRCIILIRGWGNLTGAGGLNLSNIEAANIQDTFAEYIVEQLNKCCNDKN